MAEEEWARRILEQELRRNVVLNDDNSANSIYDLRIGPADAPEMAIECVSAIDPVFAETWNVGPAQEPIQLSIIGDWQVVIVKEAKVNRIRQRIERLLQKLESRDIWNVCVDHNLKRYDEELFNELKPLGIIRAYCFRTRGTAKVHLGMRGIGGAVDINGEAITQWIGEFLRRPKQQDVISKLANSGAVECQVFVPVEFGGAPWPVESYLTGDLEHLPVAEPNLPFPVTGVWIISVFGKHGVRWDGAEWQLFEAQEASR